MPETVLLINPPIYDFAAYDLFSKPLGLLYLAAFLRKAGYDVRLLDTLDRGHPALSARFGPARVKPNGTGKYHNETIDRPKCLRHIPRNYSRYGMPLDMLTELLADEYRENTPAAVIVTSMMTYWYPGVVEVIEHIRRIMPDIPVALGGVYARLFPEHAGRVCTPDVIFTQNGFLPELKWLDGLTQKERDYSTIRDEFAAWPTPAYDLYNRLDYLTLITSLGCPFNCDYCASRLLQPQLRQIEPESFIDQMLSLLALLGDNRPRYNIAFMDDALLANADHHIIPILRRLRELDLPLRFYCPNGLHCRFITSEIAELMYANHFEMVRLSYESSDTAARWQRASDDKVTDRDFRRAIEHLIRADYRPSQLEAYILTGLPGQSMNEIEQSAQVVHDLGVKIRLCQYSPIPGTKLFDVACNDYGIDPDEPLLHNNSILPALDKRIGYETFRDFKDRITRLNSDVSS